MKKLSILIPTYNRSLYLDNLLVFIVNEIYAFDYDYEILISDNGSIDNTKKIVNKYKNQLNILNFHHEKNHGPEKNFEFLVEHANGDYLIILADDDLLDFELLNLAMNKLDENTNAIALYTPWQIWDYENKKSLCLFYEAPEAVIEKNNFKDLGNFILDHKVFAEIGIFKSYEFKKFMPIIIENLFFAFKYPIELITEGDIIFSNTPYYKTVVNYELDPKKKKEQGGFDEVKKLTHKYRYSLYHMVRLMNLENQEKIVTKLDDFIYQRMLVALDFFVSNKEFIEAYEFASIILGKYRKLDFKIKFDVIKELARLDYLKKLINKYNLKQLYITNVSKSQNEKDFIIKFFSKDNVEVIFNDHSFLENSLLFVHSNDIFMSNSKKTVKKNLILIEERILKNKFI